MNSMRAASQLIPASFSHHCRNRMLVSALLFLATPLFLATLFLLLAVGRPTFTAAARPAAAAGVQALIGRIDAGEVDIYRLHGLKAGQTLSANMQAESGDLDPVLGLAQAGGDEGAWVSTGRQALLEAVSGPRQEDIDKTGDPGDKLLAWDDDAGKGYTAAFSFTLPADGDYLLLATSNQTADGIATRGDYRLLVGVDAPDVFDASAQPTGDKLAEFDAALNQPRRLVQELRGELTPDAAAQVYTLNELKPGDTLYIFVEAVSGDLHPTLTLGDYGGKSLRSANQTGEQTHANLSFAIDEPIDKLRVRVAGIEGASGQYRLLLGLNEPATLSGASAQPGEGLVAAPIPVSIGLNLEQIIGIDQKQETLSLVASVKMAWEDPRLAFSPDRCHCAEKTFTADTLDDFIQLTGGVWPNFIIANQRNDRRTDDLLIQLTAGGRVSYTERFNADVQEDFDFRRFPFDTQSVYLDLDLALAQDDYEYRVLDGYSRIDADFVDDEFILQPPSLAIHASGANREAASRFTFSTAIGRHWSYFLFRIFIPILLILVVSWVTFFLKDYGKRIDVASGNLLLFIALSFNLAENYPRLGYLTLLDSVMAATFIVNALLVVYNVYLRRMQMQGKSAEVEKINNLIDQIYPLAWVVMAVIIILIYFR